MAGAGVIDEDVEAAACQVGHGRDAVGYGLCREDVEKESFDAESFEVRDLGRVARRCDHAQTAFVEGLRERIAEPALGAAGDEDGLFGRPGRALDDSHGREDHFRGG